MSEPVKTDFGIFYPVGYIVAGFPTASQAQKVQADLVTGGYSDDDVKLRTSQQVIDDSQKNLDEHTGFFARLGTSDEAVQTHLDAAKHGATLLLIYAPNDIEADRAMNVVRRQPFVFAHRYHRLAIEDLK